MLVTYKKYIIIKLSCVDFSVFTHTICGSLFFLVIFLPFLSFFPFFLVIIIHYFTININKFCDGSKKLFGVVTHMLVFWLHSHLHNLHTHTQPFLQKIKFSVTMLHSTTPTSSGISPLITKTTHSNTHHSTRHKNTHITNTFTAPSN